MRHNQHTRRATRRRSGTRHRSPRQTCLQHSHSSDKFIASSFVSKLALRSPTTAPAPAPEEGSEPPPCPAFPAQKQPRAGAPRARGGPAAPGLPRPDPGGGEAGPTAGHVPARLPREEATQGAAPGPGGLHCEGAAAEPARHPAGRSRGGGEDQHPPGP